MGELSDPNDKSGPKGRNANWSTKLQRHLPVTRKQHNKLLAQLEEMTARYGAQFDRLNSEVVHLQELSRHLESRVRAPDYLLEMPDPANAAAIAVVKPCDVAAAEEICLFVTFAADPKLRSHVTDHVTALADAKIAVVLVVNTSRSAAEFSFDPGLIAKLKGCLIRSNVGFDFAAWGHAYSLMNISETCQRLYLVNDSIIGPLNGERYANMLARIRQSAADLVGLTENRQPEPHLQSYFLTVNRNLLRSALFDRFMRGVRNLSTKIEVIEQYETRLTRFFRERGFRCDAVFNRPEGEPFQSNHTIHDWTRLIDDGFPFVKTEVLRTLKPGSETLRLIPQRFFKTG